MAFLTNKDVVGGGVNIRWGENGSHNESSSNKKIRDKDKNKRGTTQIFLGVLVF